MAMDKYVKKGLELAWETYRLMAEGETIQVLQVFDGAVYSPTYNEVPNGMNIHGLFTPVTLEHSFNRYLRYMELVSLNEDNAFGDKLTEEQERDFYRNTPAYIWFAENGHTVLTALAKRRNDATICIRLPESIKAGLERRAQEKNVKLSDMLRDHAQKLLAA